MKFLNWVKTLLFSIIIWLTAACNSNTPDNPVKPRLKISGDHRYIEYENGEPFLWLGGSAWGMAEWLSREEVDTYLDDRKSKGFNLV